MPLYAEFLVLFWMNSWTIVSPLHNTPLILTRSSPFLNFVVKGILFNSSVKGLALPQMRGICLFWKSSQKFVFNYQFLYWKRHCIMKKQPSTKNEHQSKYLNLLIFFRRPCQEPRSAFSHPPQLRRAQVAFTIYLLATLEKILSSPLATEFWKLKSSFKNFFELLKYTASLKITLR